MVWYHYSVSGRHDYLNGSPHFSVHRQLTAKSEISGYIAYRLSSPKPYLNIDIPILSDYRNLLIATNPDKYAHQVAGSLSYRYRNPMKSFFANISATWRHSRSSIMSNQLFIDDFIISTYADKISGSNIWNMQGALSKGLGHSRMVVGFDINYTLTSASSMRDNCEIPYRHVTAAIKPYFKGGLLSWLSANYEAECGVSQLSIDHENNICHTLHQTLVATILPQDKMNFSVGAEHFLTRFPEGNTANLILLDASAVWSPGKKVRLSLTANNLLNRRRYEYVTYGALLRSEHTFGIRQRSILASIQYRF